MKKTQEYLTLFAQFNSTEAIHAVERVLRNDPDLHKFEAAQLASLCLEEAEEAKTLVPRYTCR
jgi:DNA-directed RNA polymerase II subunit RPB4